MQATDARVGDAAGGAEGQGGQSGCCSPGSSGAVAVTPGGAHRITRGDAAPLARSDLSVPFPTPLEAEIACGALAPDAEPHRAVLGKELTVSGSILAVHWTAEDSRLLRTSIINFLEQLSLVVRTMQRFGPPVSR
ncbi:EKC/KEOPS complex subunit LAGE3 isoform X2 [Castor canadensis]|uniref:EKC/KEOPS complex subunit LAGE3 isoform X2 n=1 Tax=Castor canadensis TaxID=51338 RepID=A0AC58LT88_CASCN